MDSAIHFIAKAHAGGSEKSYGSNGCAGWAVVRSIWHLVIPKRGQLSKFMSNVNIARMTEQEKHELEWSKFMEYIDSHIKVVDKLPFDLDDAFLAKKLEEAYKTFEEAPIPDFLLKRMEEKD